MCLSKLLMTTFANYLVIVYNHRPHQRIRRNISQTLNSQVESTLYIMLVHVHEAKIAKQQERVLSDKFIFGA